MYSRGLGVSQNYGTAEYWFKKSADQGNSRAYQDLGIISFVHKKDYHEAKKWFTKAANQGMAKSQYMLALFYDNDLLGIPKDSNKVKYWAEKAVNNNDKSIAKDAKKLLKKHQKWYERIF